MPNFALTRPNWNNLDVPLEGEWDHLDGKTAAAVNGDGGGTYAPTPDPIVFNGMGMMAHMIASVDDWSVGLTETFNPYATGLGFFAGSAIRISGTIGARVLTAVGAQQAGDQVTIFCDPDVGDAVEIRNHALDPIFLLGNGSSHDGPWVTLLYVGGAWRVFRQAGGSRIRWQAFTSSGAFTVPRGINKVILLGAGGGGGGAGGNNAAAPYPSYTRGGGGGAGGLLGIRPMDVTPLASINVTIPAAAAGQVAGVNGNDAAPVLWDGGTASFTGGRGGRAYASSANDNYASSGGNHRSVGAINFVDNRCFFPGNQLGGWGGIGGNGPHSTPVKLAIAGGDSSNAIGGAQGGNASDSVNANYLGGGGGGGGGAGPFLPGAAGGGGGLGVFGGPGGAGGVGSNAANNSAAGGGGGGGGGQSNTVDGLGGAGGNGGTGFLYVFWVK